MCSLLYKLLLPLSLVLTFQADLYNSEPILKRALPEWHETTTGHAAGHVWSVTGLTSEKYIVDVNDQGPAIPLWDLRRIEDMPDIKTHGFTYVTRDFPLDASQLDPHSEAHQKILERDALDLVKDLTNSKSAISWGGVLRGPSRGSQKPYRVMHSDMSPRGAEFIKSSMILPFCETSDDEDTKAFGQHMAQDKRVVIFNVWRPLREVGRDPLALCDWQSLSDQDAWGIVNHPTDTGSSIQAWKYNEHQKWFYLDKQKPNEVFVFVQHDSSAPAGHGMNTPHAAPYIYETRREAPRISYECRIVAIVGSEFRLDHGRTGQGLFESVTQR
ncbi:uncharacterized protein MELLADRAFT_65846 [Melampsora larici-populina 98AG31]|uniref:Secreted protein n=1 Tax=Melampsora larici-populina (strain 98AG31 / pathotype 3-4-7) TaxID=747676 RepID=F4RWX2_MELLP|nr:uncharacterized protein MELLADRAFT_65846 [Melampsora larici-populina 98AG31]EGG03097.1 hypothetical protein MELLADRAFT_65846 [Melampsora larici-populina 98AG31]